ncbi:NAD-dependent epimerase/dehydratase family protein, partial [bacterium]|nr:NAD-dependent epimerase/dehydratase family protein [bacterium]
MKILVIGGTGFIGPYVVELLKNKDHDITLYNRGLSKSPITWEIKNIFGDRKNLLSFKNEFKKILPDVVLDMIPMCKRDAEDVANTFSTITGRIVCVSSQDVYSVYGKLIGIEKGSKDKTPLNEKSPFRSKLYPYRNPEIKDHNHWSYHYEKILVERTYIEHAPLPVTILRLPMVYGPKDKQHRLYEFIKRMDDGRPFIILQKDLALWRWTRAFVEDVAHAILLAILSDSAKNRIYNVGEPDALSMTQWINSIGKIMNWKGKIIEVPKESLPEK